MYYKTPRINKNYQSYILIFLIISGPIKPLFTRFLIDIDITLIAFLIAFLDLIFQTVKKLSLSKVVFPYLISLFSILILMLISLLYSPSENYALTKVVSFSLVLFCFLYASYVKHINWEIYLKCIYFLIIPLSVWFIYYRQFFWSVENARNRVYDGEFYYALGSYLGLGYLLSLAIFILIEKKKWYLVFFLFLLLLALGSRGPLLLCFLTILIVNYKRIILSLYYYKFKLRTGIIFSSVFMIIIFFVIVKFNFLKEKVYYYGLDRFISLFSSNRSDSSANERIEVFNFAIKSIFTDPLTFLFGNGIGSFGYNFTGKDLKHNPHNIFLESWYELGIIGFFLISFFLITPFFKRRNSLYLSFILFAFLDCLKSNNLAGIWILVILYSIYLKDINLSSIIKINSK